MLLNEDRQLDMMRKKANANLNKAKEILKDNTDKMDKGLGQIQNNYKNYSPKTESALMLIANYESKYIY